MLMDDTVLPHCHAAYYGWNCIRYLKEISILDTDEVLNLKNIIYLYVQG
jgi:hypothetical protein